MICPLAQTLLQLTPFFKAVDRSNFQLEEEGQTYADFMSMKGTAPNEEGTGRIDFTDVKRVSIGFIHKGRKKQYSAGLIEMVGKFMSLIYGVPTKSRELNMKVVKQGIQDSSQGLIYLVGRHEGMLDALEILDVLTSVRAPEELLIAFIDNGIHEQESSIYGRACGNQVAVIDLDIRDQRQLLVETAVHESLHTFGFDHCVAWRCLMNPLVAGQLWLCPSCMRKLFSENAIRIQEFAAKMVELCEEYGFDALKKSHTIVNFLESHKKQANNCE